MWEFRATLCHWGVKEFSPKTNPCPVVHSGRTFAHLDVRLDIHMVDQNMEKYDLTQSELGLICD